MYVSYITWEMPRGKWVTPQDGLEFQFIQHFQQKDNKFVEKWQDKIKQIFASKGEDKHYLVKFVM